MDGVTKTKMLCADEETGCNVDVHLEEKSIKEEEVLDEEEVTNEENVFHDGPMTMEHPIEFCDAGPIKTEHPLDFYDERSSDGFGILSLELDVDDNEPMLPIPLVKMEVDDEDVSQPTDHDDVRFEQTSEAEYSDQVGLHGVFDSIPSPASSSGPTTPPDYLLLGNSSKRKSQPEKWQRNVRKNRRNQGLEYVNSKGEVVPGKKMKGPCACKFDCVHRISLAEREQQFKVFWELGQSERQWDFIRQHTEIPVNRRKRAKKDRGKEEEDQKEEHENGDEGQNKEESEGQRKRVKRKTLCTRSYFFLVGDRKVKVCRTMFQNTLAIGHSYIESAYSHRNEEEGLTSTPSMVGKHDKHRKKITPDMILNIKEHVGLFPVTHLGVGQYQREYQGQKVSLAKMARLYSEWADAKSIRKEDVANPRMYVDIVNRFFKV